MKKVLIIILVVTITIAGASIYFLRGSSGFRSIYFVPDDAIAIIETKDPIQAWDKIVHSKVWNHLKTNNYLTELNSDIQTYDSLINSNALLLKLMGAKPIIMSVHERTKGKYDYIYIIDVGKVGNTRNPEKLLRSVLGNKYEVTSREYNNTKIVELLDIEASEYYFLSLTQENVILSLEPKLIEKAIDTGIEKNNGLNTKFLKVQSRISHKGLFSILFNYDNLSSVVNSLSDDYTTTFNEYTKYLAYTGLYFDINKEGLISVKGFTSFKDETPINYLKVLHEGNIETASSFVIPQRIASLTKINFENSQDYFQQLMKNMGEAVHSEYENNLKSIEKKLKIDLSKNLFSWMDKELVFMQTQPSNLGRNNELAIILQANDSVNAVNNLNFIWKQIKRNTPVKVKSITYKGYKIDYVAFPGIIQAFFGNAIKKLEKPYFTQIASSVIISNHPQTIKNIIDDFQANNTLATSMEYYNFSKLYDKKSSLYFYFEPPVFFQNMKGFVDAQTWNKLKQQKKYITCFKQGAINVNVQDELLHLDFKVQYEPETDEWQRQIYNDVEIKTMFLQAIDSVIVEVIDSLPEIIISDLDSKKHEEYYDDKTLMLEVKLKDGMKNGTLKMYHANGKLSLKGEYENDKPIGKWKYYDDNGDLIKTNYYNEK